MKLFLQALLGTIALHLIYFLTVALVGLMKTLFYQPPLTIHHSNPSTQSSVNFGTINIANPYPYSFLVVLTILYIVLRIMSERKNTSTISN